MASNVDGGDWVDCQGLLCKQGQSRGASNVCVGHFLAARCLFLCRDAFAAAFAQELDAFYVGSPGAITEGQTIIKMDFLFERWKQSIQRGQSSLDGLSWEVVHNGRMWRASRKSWARVNERGHYLDLLMRLAPAFSPASPQSIFHVESTIHLLRSSGTE